MRCFFDKYGTEGTADVSRSTVGVSGILTEIRETDPEGGDHRIPL